MSPWRKQTCHLGVSRHVTLAQTDMSPWRKRTCHFGANRHVSLEQTDMSPWSKRTCPFWRNGHVPLDTSTLKCINFGLQTRFVVPLAGLTTAFRYITAECITRQNCAFTKIRLAPWGGFWYSNCVRRIGQLIQGTDILPAWGWRATITSAAFGIA